MKKKWLQGSVAFAGCSVIAKVIGAFYRLPLTAVLGAEGMGLYQMVFPLYSLMLTLSSGGLTTALAKIIAQQSRTGDQRSTLHTLSIAMISLGVLGSLAALVVVALRRNIAGLQGNQSVAYAYLAIAPALVFVALLSGLRGYFQGLGNMLPTGISQLVEQFVKLAAGLGLAALLSNKGVVAATIGALIGVSISEAVALAVIAVQYFVNRMRVVRRVHGNIGALSVEAGAEMAYLPPLPRTRKTLIGMYKLALPVALGSLVMPVTQVIDSLLIVNLLVIGGESTISATALYGILSGSINSLYAMPSVVTLALTASLLPKLSAGGGEDKVNNYLCACLAVGLPCAVEFAVFAPQLISLLYSSLGDGMAIAIRLLRISGLCLIFLCVMHVFTPLLQSRDRAHVPALNILVGAGVKVIVTVIAVPRIGIIGGIIATVVCYAVSAALDIIAVRRSGEVKVNFRSLIVIASISAIFLAVQIFVFRCIGLLLSPLIAYLLSAVIALGVYAVLILKSKCINLREL